MSYVEGEEPWYLKRIRELEDRIDRMIAEEEEEYNKEFNKE